MMTVKNSKNFSYPGQLGILTALFGGGMIIGAVLAALIWMAMTGRPITAMQSDMLDPKYYYAIMMLQVISTIFIFLLPVYFFAKICYRRPLEFIGLKTSFNLKQVLLVVGILGLTFVFSDTLAQLTEMIPLPKSWEVEFKSMETARQIQEKALININTLPKYIISMFVIAVLPGLLEEIMFRGGIQNILTRWFKGPWIAIILTAFIFSAIHLSFYGFFVRFALGMFLGMIFYYSGSLWLSILFHFLFNGVQVTLLYLTSSAPKPTDITDQHLPIWMGLVSLVLIIYGFIRFKKISGFSGNQFQVEEQDEGSDFDKWIANNS
ncbi:MAG: type II CAAX endopeptidase family protein [Ginsengibacter sp.]|jgi:hypothetical protein